jgi:Methyltransferase domain
MACHISFLVECNFEINGVKENTIMLESPDSAVLKANTSRFRQRRFVYFLQVLDSIGPREEPVKILDVGGVPEYWVDKLDRIKHRVQITLLNLEAAKIERDGFVSVVGDARAMSQFGDGSFDVVHSNSVIEHVGQWDSMMAMASEIRRIAPAYFVQTPYYWFPIEPHARAPVLHWLPESWKLRIVMARKCGFWSRCDSVDHAMRTIQSSNLLDIAMFSALFPDAEILSEKYMGFTKSLMALRKVKN